MTGPEHYREAERLLALAGDDDDEMTWETHSARVALAQAHATLALAAATAYPAVRDYCGDEANDSREWTKATS